jgi:predicted methyltransferase
VLWPLSSPLRCTRRITAADRDNDKRRDPIDMLNFIAPGAGMKILDMGAGAGYSTELMARAAGPTGMVYGQNPPTNSRERGRPSMSGPRVPR